MHCWSWLDHPKLCWHKHVLVVPPVPTLLKCWLQAPRSSKPKAYQVPANFDKSILGEVDVSSKDAAELGLPHAFWLRWMQLREQVRASLLLPTMQCCARRVSCFVCCPCAVTACINGPFSRLCLRLCLSLCLRLCLLMWHCSCSCCLLMTCGLSMLCYMSQTAGLPSCLPPANHHLGLRQPILLETPKLLRVQAAHAAVGRHCACISSVNASACMCFCWLELWQGFYNYGTGHQAALCLECRSLRTSESLMPKGNTCEAQTHRMLTEPEQRL